MAQKSVENRHSETALFAALCRAVAAKDDGGGPGADDLALHFLPPHVRFFIRFEGIRKRFINNNMDMTPGGYEYVLVRTVFFDRLFTHCPEKDIAQIVLLGAGYDSRAYRFADAGRVSRIFELDIATTQGRKTQCLDRAGIDVPPNVTLVPINFNTDALIPTLNDAGFDADKKTLFLWEGVTMYLNPEAVAATLASISSTARTGSLVAFDYIVNVPRADAGDYYGVSKFMETWEKRRKEEPFLFTISDEGMTTLLTEQGMELVCHLDDKQIHEAYLSDQLGPVTGHFRFAVASTV